MHRAAYPLALLLTATASACACRAERWYELLESGVRPGDGILVVGIDELETSPGEMSVDRGAGEEPVRIWIERAIPISEEQARKRTRSQYAHFLPASDR